MSGVIYPAQRNGAWVPALKIYVKRDYPYPDEEGAPEGLVTHTLSLIRR